MNYNEILYIIIKKDKLSQVCGRAQEIMEDPNNRSAICAVGKIDQVKIKFDKPSAIMLDNASKSGLTFEDYSVNSVVIAVNELFPELVTSINNSNRQAVH